MAARRRTAGPPHRPHDRRHPPGKGEEFNQRYQALLRHYGLAAQAINVRQAHENGDGEQSHHRFKRALDQALMLRGSRDFQGREEYGSFLGALFAQLNKPRRKRLGEWVEARLSADKVEVYYAQKKVQEMPRLLGTGKHKIDYRHVIDWLVRKPRAFCDYRYQAEMFPSSRFRQAYDSLLQQGPRRAAKEYLGILHAAALEGEAAVEAALARLAERQQPLSAQAVQAELRQGNGTAPVPEATVGAVDLSLYDGLLESKEAVDEGG